MRIEETIINVIFDSGAGTVAQASREAIVGERFGTLPTPTRSGYRFLGWFLEGERITSETLVTAERDVTLLARWEKVKESGARHSMLRRQKTAIAVLLAATLLLALVLVGVKYIVSIYGIEDVSYTASGEEIVTQYYVRKKGGVYALFDRDGQKMPTNRDGYYLAASGNQYDIDPETGAYELYAKVDYEGSETGVLKSRLLLFPQIEQQNVYAIEVTNAEGGYKFYCTEDGNVVIEGLEDTLISYDPDRYARLCVSCGYTLALSKLDFSSPETPRKADGTVDYAVYGLEDAATKFTITQLDLEQKKNGVYAPSSVSYTLHIGSKITSESGYYVRVEGRDAVYVLTTDLEATLLQPLEAMVTPQVTSPLSMNTFTEIYNFVLGRTSLEGLSWGEMEEDELTEALEKLAIEEVVAFSFQSLLERSNTVFSATPYHSELELMKGYQIYNNRVSEVLENLYDIALLDCKHIGLTPEALAEYNLAGDISILAYLSPMTRINEDGTEVSGLMRNTLLISPRTERDTYYVASMLYNMIVEVEARSLNFLEWETDDWYAKNPVQIDLSYLKEWSMTVHGTTYDFVLDNRLSYAYFYDAEGVPTLVQSAKGTLGMTGGGEWAFRDAGGTVRKLHYVDFENGSFYRDSNANIMYKVSGGKELKISPNAKQMLVYCKQYAGTVPGAPTLIQYEIVNSYVNDKGEEKTETLTELQNFQSLVKNLLYFSVNGVVDEEEFSATYGMTTDEYIAAHGDEPTAMMRYKYEDLAAALNQYYVTKEDGSSEKLYTDNNRGEVVIRFYEYSERKSLMTIEVVEHYDINGNPILNPSSAEGKFYVLNSVLDEVLKDAEMFLAKQLVTFEN